MYYVKDICDYVLSMESMTNLKLQKILYLIQFYWLEKFHKKCFYEKIESWDFGPVIPKIYNEYRSYGNFDIPKKSSISNKIKKSDKYILNKILFHYRDYSSSYLLDLIRENNLKESIL